MESRVLLSTFTVTTTSDSGTGSLRQAILDANKTTAADIIKFAIGSGQKTISPRSRMPAISQPLTLDGTTQPGFSGKPIIELNGTSAGGVEGLKLTGSGITIKSLIVNRFAKSGIFIYSKGGNKIVGCWIGVDKTGSAAAGNKEHGIIVQSPNNVIGGTSASERNVISGNAQAGVFFYLAAGSNNKVLGNYVGTSAGGNKAIANKNGVQINGAAYVTVGGTAAGSRNVISGNIHDGVLMVTTGSKFNTVQGNYIGTNAAGTGRLGNQWYGVEISQHDNVVGGTTAAARNVISANGKDGVVFYLGTGVNNRCEGNYIGIDYTGTKDLGNTGVGVCATNGACNNMIGGPTAASRNIIAGNDLSGIGLYNASQGNTIRNNYVGIAANGLALPNAKNGIILIASSRTIIRDNKIACCVNYKPVQINSGTGTTQTNNSVYTKVSAGLRLI